MADIINEMGDVTHSLIIVEAGSKVKIEKDILDFMAAGYELVGSLSMSPKGMYIQMMMMGKKIGRSST